jgi:hypothetical protein
MLPSKLMQSIGIRSVVFTLALAASVHRAVAAEVTLESRAEEIGRLFCDNPGGYEQIFAPIFRSAVPDEQLTKILRDSFRRGGRCHSIVPVQGLNGTFLFSFDKGLSSTVELVIDPKPPHQVTGFFIGPLQGHAKSFDDVIAELKKLPATASLFVAELHGSELKPLAELNSDQPLAIGSAFKLYVLAELVAEIEKNQRQWDGVVHLTQDARSLPSGFLQTWPIGSPVTLHTLASLMISKSDNTAADQLINTLGRVKIEQMLITAGHSHPQLDVPFLTTMEMFKLKGDPAGKAADDYLAATIEQRRTMLARSIAKIPRDTIQSWTTPRHINDIEWFASNRDLARAMVWLKLHTEKSPADPARAILAINPGLQLPPQKWDYIGYKGGSEPGVLNLTFLLHAAGAGDRWFTVSATWNDPVKAVDEPAFLEIVRQAIEMTK